MANRSPEYNDVEVINDMPDNKPKMRKALMLAGACLLAGLVSGSIWHWQLSRNGVEIAWLESVALDSVFWFGWLLVAAGLTRLVKRFPLRKTPVYKLILVHIPIAIIGGVGAFSIYAGVYTVVAFFQNASSGQPFVFSDTLVNYYRGYYLRGPGIFMNLLTYIMIAAGCYARNYWKMLQAERLRNLELQAALTQAQLHALKMQLQPHFLFNTLNSISSLIHEEINAADQMLTRLARFLRTTLENSQLETVSLEQELEFARNYLDIEQVRFEERLHVEYDISSDVKNAAVPNLLLQPLLENAIKHGVSKRLQPGWIKISAKRNNGNLNLKVEDSGPEELNWKPDEKTLSEGIGIRNSRDRLKRLYENDFELTLSASEQGGITVTLEIPLKQHNEKEKLEKQ